MERFGPRFRENRKKREITMLEFCHRAKINQGYWSRVERGETKPPRKELLERAVRALGMARWNAECLYTSAALERLELPPRLLENEVLAKHLAAILTALVDADYHQIQGVLKALGEGREYNQDTEYDASQVVYD